MNTIKLTLSETRQIVLKDKIKKVQVLDWLCGFLSDTKIDQKDKLAFLMGMEDAKLSLIEDHLNGPETEIDPAKMDNNMVDTLAKLFFLSPQYKKYKESRENSKNEKIPYWIQKFMDAFTNYYDVEEDDEEDKITDKESSQTSISKFPDHVLAVWANLGIDTEWTSEQVLANVQKSIDKKNTEYAKKNEKEIEKIKKKLPTLQKELAKLWNLLTKLQQEMEETDKRIKKHEKKAKTLRNTAIALVVAFSVFIGYKAITTESSNQIIEISKSTPKSTVPDTTTLADGQELPAETEEETNPQDSSSGNNTELPANPASTPANGATPTAENTAETKVEETVDVNSVAYLCEHNPTFKANWERAEELFEAKAGEVVPQIITQDGKASENDMMAFRINEYFGYKNFPENFSIEDKATFLFFLTQNSKYDYDNPNRASDQTITLEFAKRINWIEEQMKTNKNLANTAEPTFFKKGEFSNSGL